VLLSVASIDHQRLATLQLKPLLALPQGIDWRDLELELEKLDLKTLFCLEWRSRRLLQFPTVSRFRVRHTQGKLADSMLQPRASSPWQASGLRVCG
jgi:hypothetical protein